MLSEAKRLGGGAIPGFVVGVALGVLSGFFWISTALSVLVVWASFILGGWLPKSFASAFPWLLDLIPIAIHGVLLSFLTLLIDRYVTLRAESRGPETERLRRVGLAVAIAAYSFLLFVGPRVEMQI